MFLFCKRATGRLRNLLKVTQQRGRAVELLVLRDGGNSPVAGRLSFAKAEHAGSQELGGAGNF